MSEYRPVWLFPQDKEPKGIIPLENIQVQEVVSEKSNRQNAFELFAVSGSDVIKACKVDSDGKVVEGESFRWTFTRPLWGDRVLKVEKFVSVPLLG